MSVRAYQTGRVSHKASHPVDERRALLSNQVRLKAHSGPYDWRLRGEDWKNKSLNLGATMSMLRWQVPRLKIGEAIQVRSLKDQVTFFTRVIDIEDDRFAPCPDSGATQQIQDLWDLINSKIIPEVELELGYQLRLVQVGIYNCRHISGSSRWSQHAWRNALDWFLVRVTGGGIDMHAMDLAVAKVRAKFPCECLWRIPDHYGHSHTGGCPTFEGWPPCA